VPAPYRVLAVEDDTDAMTLMRLVLRALPLEITHVMTGAAARAHLESETPDLLLLDLNLPDMRGWDLLEHFKGDERLRHMRVIVLTSHAEPVHRLIGMLQPIRAYLNKPVTAERLRQHVREALSLP
jgi:chemosensory pili system protein ChpA (sensor histidine kinase/response regulator)